MMPNAKSPRSKWLTFSLAIASLAAISAPVLAQNSSKTGGYVDDWSTHHAIFSNPGPEVDALKGGRYDQWLKIANEPRYQMQQAKRKATALQPTFVAPQRYGFGGTEGSIKPVGDSEFSGRFGELGNHGFSNKKRVGSAIDKDWSMSINGSGAAGTGAMAINAFPAKYSFSTTAGTCSDYVAYTTGLAGAAAQATIIGFSNLYATTCTAPVPSISFAYNTGGTSNLSPIISSDGTQIAYVETVAAAATLVVLKVSPGSGGSAGAPTFGSGAGSVANGSYRACTAPCYTTLTFSGSPADTNSSPFYIYSSFDTLYVGDNSGKLHKFTGVFAGTPTESGSPWPVTVDSGFGLTSPVVDPVSTNIFVGDTNGKLSYVNAAGTTVTSSAGLMVAGSTGIVDAPLIDVTALAAPKVYAFVGNDTTAGGGAVVQFTNSFAAANAGITEALGSGATTTLQYAGDFDNIHYSGAGTTGNLYVCGYHTTGTTPRLFQIAMNATFTGASTTVVTPAGGAATCSPVTEFNGNAHDWIFLSMTANGTDTGCTGACLYNYNVSTTPAAATAGIAETGGTSGIVVDNNLTTAGESQIYYTTLGVTACAGNTITGSAGTRGCAIQASQAAP